MAADVSATGAEGTARSREPADLRARIVDAATRLFAEQGWAGTQVRAVAEAAGCTVPALYYHFAGKEALWAAAVQEAHRRLHQIQLASRSAGSVREQLTASYRALVASATNEPHSLWLLFRAERHPGPGEPAVEVDDYRRITQGRTEAMLREGIATGELRPDIDVDLVVTQIHGVAHFRLEELFYFGCAFEERWAERAVEQLFRGLSA